MTPTLTPLQAARASAGAALARELLRKKRAAEFTAIAREIYPS